MLDEKDLQAIAGLLKVSENSLNERIDRVENSLNERIDRVESSLNERIDRVENSIEEVKSSLNERIDRVENSIEEVKSSLNERIDRVESSIEEVRGSLNEKIDRVERTLLDETDRVWKNFGKQFTQIQKNNEDFQQYYRIVKLENDNTALLLRRMDDLSSKIAELQMKIA